MNICLAVFVAASALLAAASAQINESIVFDVPWGTNRVFLSFTAWEKRYVPPNTNAVSTVHTPPPSRDWRSFYSGMESFWRYRIRAGLEHDSTNNLILWEKMFRNYDGDATPKMIEVLDYLIAPNSERVVVLSRDRTGVYGEISQPGVGGATNIIQGSLASLFLKGSFDVSNPPVSGKLGSGARNGTYNATVRLRDGAAVEFVFTGYRWRPKLWVDAQVKDADPSTGEVFVFDRPHGTNRVVCSYRPLDDLTGLRLATEAKGATVAGDEVEPFDRKYRLVLRSPEQAKELVLWEKLFTCDETTRVAGFPVWKSFSDPSIKFRGPSDQIVGTRIIDPSVKVLGVFVDPDLPRAVVFYYHRNCIFGEVLQPGVSKATNLPGAKQFSWLNYEPEAPTAVLSRSGKLGTYQVNLTFGSGRKSSFRFDGSQWVTD